MRIFRGRAFQAAVKAKTQAWKQEPAGLIQGTAGNPVCLGQG